MKKAVTIILLIIILLNNILPRFCYAEPEQDGTTETTETTETEEKRESLTDVESSYTIDSYNSLNNDGSAEIRGKNTDYIQMDGSPTMKQTALVYVVTIFNVLPMAVNILMTVTTLNGYERKSNEDTQFDFDIIDTDSNVLDELKELWMKSTRTDYFDQNSMALAEALARNLFTIESIIKNERPIFDINFFDLDESNPSTINKLFRQTVAIWFYTIRSLAIILSLLVLIYVGIRMAISTTAVDKAKYKNMLVSWFESFLIIFVMPYILIAVMQISNLVLELINKVQGEGFEYTLMAEFYYSMFTSNGYELILWSVGFWLLVWYQFKFFFAYGKRFFSIGFMIIIAPLVSVTYAIDKLGDGRAQGFGMLLKELIVNIIIQPIHAIIFAVFIVTANEVAKVAPILAIIFLASLSRVEKIVKNVFNLRGLSSIHSLGAIAPIGKKH